MTNKTDISKQEEMIRDGKGDSHLLQIISALAYEYSTVICVNLKKDTVEIIKIHPRVEKTAPQLFTESSYTEGKAYYIDKILWEDDKEEARRKSTIAYMSEHLSWPDSYSLVYRNILGQYGEEKIVRIDEETVVIGFAGKDEEIRRQKKYEEDLKNAKANAEAANEAKSAFLTSMSHDIRTPMNAVLGLTELAKKNVNDPEKMMSYLKEISTSGEQLLHIINRVLEISHIESKKVDILEENTSTKAVYDSLVTVFRNQARDKKLEITFENNIKYDWLFMDRTHMEEVVNHVIGNAIKYTPNGGHIEVTFNSLPGKDEMHTVSRITVSDTGVGMSEEFQAKAYQQFAREYDSTVSGVQGSGLGLTIVKRLVELMNGTVEIESKKGVGTKVVLEVPHKIGFDPGNEGQLKTEFDDAILVGKRVLLAEDIDVNALIAQEILSSKGLLVERANNGRECVNMLMNAEDDYYDVILMDIQMPELNGYQATETIRNLSDQSKASIPIIALTANAFVEDRIKAISVGMNSHVGKPINVEQLFGAISRALTFKHYYINNNELSAFKKSYAEAGCRCGYFVYLANKEERIIAADAATALIFGCSDSEEFLEYVGSSFRGMVHPDDLNEVEAEIDLQQEKNRNSIDRIAYRIIRKDGQVRNVVDIGYKAFDGKDILYYVYIADVTDVE